MTSPDGKPVRVGVVGLGYVGLPLAVAFAEAGHSVVGVDTDTRKVAAVAAGESHIEDIPSERLAAVGGLLTASTDYNVLADCDAVLIAVPTPLTANREPDLGPLISSARALARVLREGQLVVLESTTYPGTTREQLVPLLEESGLAAGRDFNVAFSPERVDPGRTDHTLRTTPKIVGGLTLACRDRAVTLYRHRGFAVYETIQEMRLARYDLGYSGSPHHPQIGPPRLGEAAQVVGPVRGRALHREPVGRGVRAVQVARRAVEAVATVLLLHGARREADVGLAGRGAPDPLGEAVHERPLEVPPAGLSHGVVGFNYTDRGLGGYTWVEVE